MKTADYFDLSVSAPVRLARMRRAFAEHASKYPHCPEHAKPKSWCDIRGTTYKGLRAYVCDLSQGSNGGTPIWCCHTGPQFRGEKLSSDVLGRFKDTDWYTDIDGRETARGIVARLPHGRCIAGYEWTSNGERVYFPEIFDDIEDAARMGAEHARVFAESAFEDSQQYDAARTLENEIDDAFHRLRECLALRHRACMGYVRDEIRELISGIKKRREILATEYADYV